MMNKEDFINTKWDARDWSEEMKGGWLHLMFSHGFLFAGQTSFSPSSFHAGFYFICHEGLIRVGGRADRVPFEESKNKSAFFHQVFDEEGKPLALPATKTEQGQKHDGDKPRYDLLPPIAIDEMAKVMTFGAEKYAPDNWRHVDNAVERYRAALLRHSFAMLRGEKLDPETGLPHAAHAMCCAAFLVEVEK